MSIVRATLLNAERAREIRTADATVVSKSASETALEQISTYMPTEIIGLYIGATGIVSPSSYTGKWAIFSICVLVIIFLMVYGILLSRKKDLPLNRPSRYFLQFIIILFAFSTWVCAMPENPFFYIFNDAQKIGSVSALVLAITIPKIAELLDIKPYKKG